MEVQSEKGVKLATPPVEGGGFYCVVVKLALAGWIANVSQEYP